MNRKVVLGVIGGSGVGSFVGNESCEMQSDFVADRTFNNDNDWYLDELPSGAIKVRVIGGRSVFFLPRHGEGHTLNPSEVPYRANILALKKLGVTHVLSISAVGSMKSFIKPGDVVLPNQLVDATKGLRKRTFFEGCSVVAHASMAEPFDRDFRNLISKVLLKDLGIVHHATGAYVCIEGPQFSTRAESWMYINNIPDLSVIGMTACPEAHLARELGLRYQTVAVVTDYDCWNDDAGPVDSAEVVRVMKKNGEKVGRIIAAVVPALPDEVVWENRWAMVVSKVQETGENRLEEVAKAKFIANLCE